VSAGAGRLAGAANRIITRGFDAPELRQIATISDVLDFLEQLQAA
jgi:hypothetical protein